MKNIFKKITLLMMMLLCTVVLCACGEDETVVEETEAETEPAYVLVERDASELNLLTGEDTLSEEAKGKRPVAVMVNNIKPAFPQYGIAQADIIFEVLVEGNQTRFMCLYGDYTQVPKICSVRSARKYFPAISEGFDAIYVHWGMAEDAIGEYIESLELTRFDGASDTNGLFGRDKDRKAAGYSLEHTGYFDGTKLAEVLEKKDLRTDIEADKSSTAFLFNETAVKPEGTECTKATVKFGAATAVFTYDEETKTYFKMHNGEDQVDGKTGTQLEFTNVFILETLVGTDPNGTHKLINWNCGTGYYLSQGVAQEIQFIKNTEQDRLILLDMEGNELAINPGKSYFSINEFGKSALE